MIGTDLYTKLVGQGEEEEEPEQPPAEPPPKPPRGPDEWIIKGFPRPSKEEEKESNRTDD